MAYTPNDLARMMEKHGIDIEIIHAIENLTATDNDAIHDNIAAEISIIPEKGVPVNADLVVIEDSAAGNAKRRVQVGNLPAGGGGEINTASSAGIGTSLFFQKVAFDLEFNAIKSENALLTIALDGITHDIELTINEANFVLDGITAEIDAIDSNVGAFPFDTTGIVTFNQDVTVPNLITAGNVDGVDVSAISITNMPTAVNNWKVFCTNGAGVMTEIATGAANTVLTGNGVAAAPSFQAVGGGAPNAFSIITGIVADVVADNNADTLTFAAAGGLTIVGTALTDTITFTNTITQYTDAMVDARIIVQNTNPAGTIDIAIDALIATHALVAAAHHAVYLDANAVAAVEAAGLTMANPIAMGANNITLGVGQTVDGVDVSAISITNMPTAVNNWKVFCTNGAGVMTEIATGAAGTFLGGNGVGAAPSFQAGGGGGESLAATLAIGNETDGANIEIDSGGDLIVYSDDGVTEVARIDGATGNITTVGTVDGVDISTIVQGGDGTDTTAIHDDTAAEISAIANKPVPTGSDYLIIEDYAVADAKKHITIAQLEAILNHDNILGVSVDDHHAEVHVHDAQTLQFDGVNSDGGLFSFATTDSIAVDMVSAGATTFSINNSGAGIASLDITGNITVSGTVDGIDIAAISITNMPTAVNNWKVYCTNGAGVMTEIATGAAGTFLGGNGVGALPSFQAGGAGETNTASNAGAGTSLYFQKVVADLQFNGIKSENNLLAVALDGVSHDIELTINEANFVLDGITAQIDGINSDGGAFAFATTGSIGVDMVNAGATIFSITNSGAGVASLDITGNITVSGTVDGIDIAAISITNMPTAVNNWMMYATNGAGVMTEIAVGAVGTILSGAGVGAAPTFAAPEIVYDVSPQLGADLDLNQKSIELDETPDVDDTGQGFVITDDVDENTQGFGNALHLDTDGNWIDAHADAASTAMPCRGLALEAGTGAGKKILLFGMIRDDGWAWTIGAPIYVSDTASGDLTETRPAADTEMVQIIGWALSATVIFFCPDNTWIELSV